MNLRDKKGSITIFVLVGLLFMSAFLIILYASNINRSKIAKEQFNMISQIYSKGSDGQSYTDAYTELRKENKQTMTSYVENNSILELTKTFEEKVSNYKIYGNSIQNVTPTQNSPIELQSVGEKTLNIFNQAITRTTSFSSFSNTSVRALEEGVWYLGLTPNNYSQPDRIKEYSLDETTTTFTTTQTAYGLTQAFKCQPNQKYWFNCITNDGNRVGFGFYDADGNFISFRYWSSGSSFNTPEGCYWMTVSFVGLSNTETTYSNVQLSLEEMPEEYEPYGKYKIPVKVSGKNLFKVGTLSDYYNTTSNFTITGNTIVGKNAAGSASYITNNTYYECNTGDSYTFSYDADMGQNRIYVVLYDKDKNNISSAISINGLTYNQYYGGGALFKAGSLLTINITDDNIKYLRFGFATYDQSLDTSLFITVTNVQLEKGTNRTSYEPYKGYNFNIYLDEPLRKIGAYQDYIDFKTNKVVRYVKEIICAGTENWHNLYDAANTNNYYYIRIADYQTVASNMGFCTHFERKNISYSTPGVIGYNATNSSTYNEDRIIIRPDMTVYTDVSKWKEYLVSQYELGKPIKCYYTLLQEDDENNEIINAPELKTIEDYTKIEVLTEVTPSKIEVIYEGYTLE